MIRIIFIVKDGLALAKYYFGECHSFGENDDIIAGFIQGLSQFAITVMNSKLQYIVTEDHVIQFHLEQYPHPLLFIFFTEKDDDPSDIEFKMNKVAELFNERYSEILTHFTGERTQFYGFKQVLLDRNITQINCGGHSDCKECPHNIKNFTPPGVELNGN